MAETEPMLDLVFMSDCTGSMGSYISAAQQNIRQIVEQIVVQESMDVRFALVCYRDHPPQDSSYVTTVFDFTDDISAMRTNVDTMSASGGGDGPESLCDAFYDAAHNVTWRDDAMKFVVCISDAPPHGLGENGDGFPNGCPDGRDCLRIVLNEFQQKGIILYMVCVEASLTTTTRSLFHALAELGGGRAVSLVNASSLAQVIVGGVQEEHGLEDVFAQLETIDAEVRSAAEAAGETLTDSEVDSRAAAIANERGIQINTLNVENAAAGAAAPHVDLIMECPDLATVRERFAETGVTGVSSAVGTSYLSAMECDDDEMMLSYGGGGAPRSAAPSLASASLASAPSAVYNRMEDISEHQYARVMSRKRRAAG